MAAFTNITIGQYLPGDSFIHRLDPRTKLLLTLFIIVILFLVNTFIGYGLVALYIAVFFALSQLPSRYVLKGLRPLIVIIILTLALNVFMTPGEVLWKWGFLTVTREGLVKGAMMGLRLILLIIGTSLLTLTTSPIALTDGIESLLSPGKKVGVPAHELAMMMTIALRFIPTLLEETEKIMKAQMARGADFESGNMLRRAKSLIPLLVPLFVSAFRRADELATAMEARCYRGGEGRTKLHQLRYTFRDYVSLGVSICFMTAVAWFF